MQLAPGAGRCCYFRTPVSLLAAADHQTRVLKLSIPHTYAAKNRASELWENARVLRSAKCGDTVCISRISGWCISISCSCFVPEPCRSDGFMVMVRCVLYQWIKALSLNESTCISLWRLTKLNRSDRARFWTIHACVASYTYYHCGQYLLGWPLMSIFCSCRSCHIVIGS